MVSQTRLLQVSRLYRSCLHNGTHLYAQHHPLRNAARPTLIDSRMVPLLETAKMLVAFGDVVHLHLFFYCESSYAPLAS